jgi:hypothetical protein
MGPVQTITLRRTGSPDVVSPAAVIIGGFSSSVTEVVGEIQQTGDKVLLTSRVFDTAGWSSDPGHGDLVIYADGRMTVVQGPAQVHRFESNDRVFVLRCLGG